MKKFFLKNLFVFSVCLSIEFRLLATLKGPNFGPTGSYAGSELAEAVKKLSDDKKTENESSNGSGFFEYDDSLKNNTIYKVFVDKDGNVTSINSTLVTIRTSSTTTNSGQSTEASNSQPQPDTGLGGSEIAGIAIGGAIGALALGAGIGAGARTATNYVEAKKAKASDPSAAEPTIREALKQTGEQVKASAPAKAIGRAAGFVAKKASAAASNVADSRAGKAFVRAVDAAKAKLSPKKDVPTAGQANSPVAQNPQNPSPTVITETGSASATSASQQGYLKKEVIMRTEPSVELAATTPPARGSGRVVMAATTPKGEMLRAEPSVELAATTPPARGSGRVVMAAATPKGEMLRAEPSVELAATISRQGRVPLSPSPLPKTVSDELAEERDVVPAKKPLQRSQIPSTPSELENEQVQKTPGTFSIKDVAPRGAFGQQSTITTTTTQTGASPSTTNRLNQAGQAPLSLPSARTPLPPTPRSGATPKELPEEPVPATSQVLNPIVKQPVKPKAQARRESLDEQSKSTQGGTTSLSENHRQAPEEPIQTLVTRPTEDERLAMKNAVEEERKSQEKELKRIMQVKILKAALGNAEQKNQSHQQELNDLSERTNLELNEMGGKLAAANAKLINSKRSNTSNFIDHSQENEFPPGQSPDGSPAQSPRPQPNQASPIKATMQPSPRPVSTKRLSDTSAGRPASPSWQRPMVTGGGEVARTPRSTR